MMNYWQTLQYRKEEETARQDAESLFRKFENTPEILTAIAETCKRDARQEEDRDPAFAYYKQMIGAYVILFLHATEEE